MNDEQIKYYLDDKKVPYSEWREEQLNFLRKAKLTNWLKKGLK